VTSRQKSNASAVRGATDVSEAEGAAVFATELDADDVPARKADSQAQRPPKSPGREPQPPSWRRTLKRGLVFAPIMFVTVMLLTDDLTIGAQIAQTAFIVGIFVPFSYLLDGVLWRSYKKRAARRVEDGSGR